MHEGNMDDVMDRLWQSGYLGEFDEIIRKGHAIYRSYPPAFLRDHTPIASALVIQNHIAGEMDRQFNGRMKSFDLQGLRLWLFKDVNVVVRTNKMTKSGNLTGVGRQTQQTKDYDAGNELPGLPLRALRLAVGYWENRSGLEINRTQVARPVGKKVEWSAAILPPDQRQDGARIWTRIVQQRRIA